LERRSAGPDLPPAEKAKRFISSETYRGIERTIRGFTGADKFVLGEAAEDDNPYVNALSTVHKRDKC